MPTLFRVEGFRFSFFAGDGVAAPFAREQGRRCREDLAAADPLVRPSPGLGRSISSPMPSSSTSKTAAR